MELSSSLAFIENAIKFRELRKVFRYHSAQVQCWSANGVTYGDYSGVLSGDACKYLGQNLQRLAGPTPTFERIHHAVTMPFARLPCSNHMLGSRPGVFIVRPDQYQAMTEFSGMLATIGVVRLTFLESQADLAHHWVSQFH